MPRLFEDLALTRLDGRFPRLIDKLARGHLFVRMTGAFDLADRVALMSIRRIEGYIGGVVGLFARLGWTAVAMTLRSAC